jgi:hypothetical protein
VTKELAWLLATVTGFAFVFLIVSFAVRGNRWAAGLVMERVPA